MSTKGNGEPSSYYVMRFKHKRFFEGEANPSPRENYNRLRTRRQLAGCGMRPSAHGGLTLCTISEDDIEVTGAARCRETDAFCYRTGRILAMLDALSMMAGSRAVVDFLHELRDRVGRGEVRL